MAQDLCCADPAGSLGPRGAVVYPGAYGEAYTQGVRVGICMAHPMGVPWHIPHPPRELRLPARLSGGMEGRGCTGLVSPAHPGRIRSSPREGTLALPPSAPLSLRARQDGPGPMAQDLAAFQRFNPQPTSSRISSRNPEISVFYGFSGPKRLF